MMRTEQVSDKYRVSDYSSIPLSKIEEADIENLRHIANRSVVELCKQNPNLLVFPYELNVYKDDIDIGVICSMDSEQLKTNDIMGFVGRNDSQLTIYSRFAKNEGEDYFLHYMVQKVFNINIFDLKHSTSKDKVFDFLVYLFPYYLKRALKQGLYKQYVVNHYNDAHVRGVIDVSRQIKLNIPFVGKIAYKVKEFSYDNNITQLIRHTIEYIRTSYMSAILKSDLDTEESVLRICDATSTYKTPDRDRIISKNLTPLTHPYYLAYRGLQKLCVQILTHKGLKYGRHTNKIYGLLFRGSWLWEEFLYKTVLDSCGFRHPQNRIGKGGIYLFEKNPTGENSLFVKGSRCRRYPDYIKENFILDAKYKRLENNHIDRNDMHQIIAYMYVEKAYNGGFIYPNDKAPDSKIVMGVLGNLRGHGGYIYNIGVPIPKESNSYKDFVLQMKKTQETLKQKICELTLTGEGLGCVSLRRR